MISSLWHLGNYWLVNEHLVSKIDVFEAGKMGQLAKSQTLTDDWIQSVSTTAALVGPCSGQNRSKMLHEAISVKFIGSQGFIHVGE